MTSLVVPHSPRNGQEGREAAVERNQFTVSHYSAARVNSPKTPIQIQCGTSTTAPTFLSFLLAHTTRYSRVSVHHHPHSPSYGLFNHRARAVLASTH